MNLFLASRAARGEPQNEWAALCAAQKMTSEKSERQVLMGVEGIEPSTSSLSEKRSTNELHAQCFLAYQKERFFQAKNLSYLFNIFELFFKNFFNIGQIF